MFVSVKGVYFQAEVMGEPITWLVPHPFTQSLPREVDVRVMITFLEFYEVLMKFVLFKLYHTQGLRYPPTEDQALKEAGCFLLAIKPMPIDAVVGSELVQGQTAGMIETKERGKTNIILYTLCILSFFLLTTMLSSIELYCMYGIALRHTVYYVIVSKFFILRHIQNSPINLSTIIYLFFISLFLHDSSFHRAI